MSLDTIYISRVLSNFLKKKWCQDFIYEDHTFLHYTKLVGIIDDYEYEYQGDVIVHELGKQKYGKETKCIQLLIHWKISSHSTLSSLIFLQDIG